MWFYDQALVEIKEGWEEELYNDGWHDLGATPRLNTKEGYFSYNTKEDGYKIRICHNGTQWLENNAC